MRLRLSAHQQTTQEERQNRRLRETLHHERTASPLGSERRIRGVAYQPSIAHLNGARPVGRVYVGVRDLHDGCSLAIQRAE